MSPHPMARSTRGRFIVFEGPEGSGKSTHARLLYEALRAQGLSCTLTREPGGTKVAEMVRRIILSPAMRMSGLTELLLYEAARAQHVAEIIRPALDRGEVVICDRFTDASLVYQGCGRGIDRRTIRQLNAIATGGLCPDFTIILDADSAVGLARVIRRRRNADRMERESLEFHRAVRQGYRTLARRANTVMINTERTSVQRTHEWILRMVRQRTGL